jgi:hypothetical protein
MRVSKKMFFKINTEKSKSICTYIYRKTDSVLEIVGSNFFGPGLFILSKMYVFFPNLKLSVGLKIQDAFSRLLI